MTEELVHASTTQTFCVVTAVVTVLAVVNAKALAGITFAF
jgi:hypothetical protein